MDPYRDNNLKNRVDELERQVTDLQTRTKGAKGTIMKGFREGLHDGFKNGSIWAGSGLMVIVLCMIFMFPSCVRSCQDSPEQTRAMLEVEQAQSEQYETSCQAMNMHYIGFSNRSQTLTCGNENEIVMVNLYEHSTQTQSVHSQ